MAWEALNNIAAAKDLKLVIIVNDNGRSYSDTVGGLATHLTSLRTNPRYEKILDLIKKNLGRTPYVGAPMYEVLHGVKKGLKDMLAPQGMFEDLGLKYVGPVAGHDREAMEDALRSAKAFGGPVIVHAVTQKGFGYAAAEQDEEDNFHQVRPVNKPRGWTDVFGDEIVADRPPSPGRGRGDRGDAAPDRPGAVRGRSSRTGSSMSASPSSTR